MRAALPYAVLWLAALAAAPRESLAQANGRQCEEYERCVELTKCPALNKPPQTQEERQRLRGYLCGFENRRPQVCCPLLPLDECGPQNNADKIIGGNKTIVQEFPWAVRLGYRVKRGIEYRCGGSLISSRYVLTAAHCVVRTKPVTVRLGEHDVRQDPDCSRVGRDTICADKVVDVAVEKVTSHGEYGTDTLYNDIALLRLRRDVAFTTSVTPVCLPVSKRPSASGPYSSISLSPEQAEKDWYGDYVLTVVGWGKIHADELDQTTGDVLTKLNLKAVRDRECADRYNQLNKYRVNKRMQLCAIGKPGTDVCRGDSGGPLTTVTLLGGEVRSVLRGIVSFGPPDCATKGVPAGYTNVINYLPWIMSNMQP